MNSENKNTSKDSSNDWKEKINDLVNTCQTELKKTTKIGMKMFSASQANGQLHETYEAIGRWAVSSMDEGTLKIEDEKLISLIAKVKELEKSLMGFEEEVQEIKKSE